MDGLKELSDLLSDPVIHVKCRNEAAQHRNTYLKCNRLKFSLNCARSAPQANRKRFNSPYSGGADASHRNNGVVGETKEPEPPPPTLLRNSPLQLLKCLSFCLITRPPHGGNGGAHQSVAGAEGNKRVWLLYVSDVGRHGRGRHIHFCFAQLTRFSAFENTSTYSWIHHFQVAINK